MSRRLSALPGQEQMDRLERIDLAGEAICMSGMMCNVHKGSQTKPQISLVVTDLDNTLYDWVDMWYKAFSAMLEQLVLKSGVQQAILETEIQAIFRKHGTSEYAFVIEEIPSLKSKHPDEDLTVVYQNAINAYRNAREASLRLFPGVRKTLETLRGLGCWIVGYTSSMGFYTMARLKKLSLDGLLHYVYSPPDHAKPAKAPRHHEDDWYRLHHTVHRFTPAGEAKPDPRVLLGIIAAEGIRSTRERTAYVGDSLLKDIRMAQDAGVTDVYAKYGSATDKEAYNLLRRVTHWSKADVERERRVLASHSIVPTYTLEHSFKQLLDLFDFVPHELP